MARVVFLHPDLGIGGAERLVVDAAVALKSQGCSIQIWTAHYDPTHCFSETLDPDLPVVRERTHIHTLSYIILSLKDTQQKQTTVYVKCRVYEEHMHDLI